MCGFYSCHEVEVARRISRGHDPRLCRDFYMVETHVYPPPKWRCLTENEAVPLVVYFRLRIVSITLTSKVLDVLEMVAVVVGGGVSAFPSVGMFPANIVVESAHISVSAIASRFMGVAPFELRKCRNLYINADRIEWDSDARLLARWARANYYPVCIRSTSR